MIKAGKKPTLAVYHVRDANRGRSFGPRIGAAWANMDGGFSLQLDCIPMDGRIDCCPPNQDEE